MTFVELPLILHKKDKNQTEAMFEELGIPNTDDTEILVKPSCIDLEIISMFYEDVETPTTILMFDPDTRVEIAMEYKKFLELFKTAFETIHCEVGEGNENPEGN